MRAGRINSAAMKKRYAQTVRIRKLSQNTETAAERIQQAELWAGNVILAHVEVGIEQPKTEMSLQMRLDEHQCQQDHETE